MPVVNVPCVVVASEGDVLAVSGGAMVPGPPNWKRTA